jgi:2-keto-4-pentenoate hydratase
MGADLKGEELTISDVLDATDSVSASFEICDSRIKDWKCPYADWYADNGFAARVVLPGRWTPARDIDMPGETTVLMQDSRQIADGHGGLVMEHPARAVAWLARSLTEHGRQLEAGMLVMTGSLTPVTKVTRGSAYAASFSTLGSVDITFV